jgi:hypothetical protein
MGLESHKDGHFIGVCCDDELKASVGRRIAYESPREPTASPERPPGRTRSSTLTDGSP